MSELITHEQLEKLPKWAKQHIKDLQRERDVAVRRLNEWTDSQTPSPVSTHEWDCTKNGGPELRVRYIQSRRVNFKAHGVSLDIYIPCENDSQRGPCIELSWHADSQRTGEVAFIPSSYQQARLVAQKNIRE